MFNRLPKAAHSVDLSRFKVVLKQWVLRRAVSDGSMSASGSAGPGFDPQQGSKF